MNNSMKAQSDFEVEKEQVKRVIDEEKDKAGAFYDHAKASVSELYNEGKKKIEHAQDTLHDYSNELINQAKDKPLSTILIAGGIGYLLSVLFRKL